MSGSEGSMGFGTHFVVGVVVSVSAATVSPFLRKRVMGYNLDSRSRMCVAVGVPVMAKSLEDAELLLVEHTHHASIAHLSHRSKLFFHVLAEEHTVETRHLL